MPATLPVRMCAAHLGNLAQTKLPLLSAAALLLGGAPEEAADALTATEGAAAGAIDRAASFLAGNTTASGVLGAATS